MKRIIAAALAAIALVAHADTAGPAYLYKGSSTLGSYPTMDLCDQTLTAGVNAGTYAANATYSCRVNTIRTFVIAKRPPSETQNAVCLAPTTGTYPQTKAYTYSLASGWAAGPWTPATPPDGACVAPANPFPNGETQTVQCSSSNPDKPLGSWTQTRTYTLSASAWVAGSWLPQAAPVGACNAAPTTASWTFLASEGGAFSVGSSPQTVRYGAAPSWIQKSMAGSGTCSNSFFGSDPSQGTVKTCELLGSQATPPTTTSTGATASNWITVATNEMPNFSVGASTPVRYGYGANWVSKTLSGAQVCTGSTFGNVDPAPGYYKECQKQITADAVVQTGAAPVVNIALAQPPRPAYTADRLVTGAGYEAGPFDIGAFRLTCNFSHFAFDDPIVFPGQPGASHLHMFFGNAGVTANSTASSIASTGNSTCAGGTLNRTGYWVPAMVNMKTGAPIVPTSVIWYYKSGYLGVKAEDVKPFPTGLRMIAGSASNKVPLPAGGLIRFSCSSGSAYYGYIPSCPVGDTMDVGIQFPQCWDGTNLDSPDHKSHMAYATGNGCPSTHPVGLAEVSLNMHYTVVDLDPASSWKLSSDNYVGQGGYSMHADWFNGWNEPIMNEWVTNCVNKRASSTNALCDGRGLQ